jgi:hypothetical protein
MFRRRGSIKVPSVDVREAILKQRRYAPVLGFLITPFALSGYVLAFWRLGADLNWLGEFFIKSGLFSRWQVWLALAIAMQILANQLNRFGGQDPEVMS